MSGANCLLYRSARGRGTGYGGSGLRIFTMAQVDVADDGPRRMMVTVRGVKQRR